MNRVIMNNRQGWIVSCNPNFYDIAKASTQLNTIDWKQRKVISNAKQGDIVYIYVSGKENGFIKYKAIILKSNKPKRTIDDLRFIKVNSIEDYDGEYMEIKIFKELAKQGRDLMSLKEHGIKKGDCMTGPKRVCDELQEYLDSLELLTYRIYSLFNN